MKNTGEVAAKSDIREWLLQDNFKQQFKMALPKHITPERFVRIAITAISKNSKLLQCTRESLLSCLIDLSQLGLEPDGRLAHLIPYGTECKLIVDYKGYVDLARRSGEVADVHADVVFENDFFEYSFGSEGKLVHRPVLANRGAAKAAYSFVKLKDGSSSFEVMGIPEVEVIKERSEGWKAFKKGIIKTNPWYTDWNEMAKKTVFRRHSKWLPLSSEKFRIAIEKDFDSPTELVMQPSLTTIPMPQASKQITSEGALEETVVPIEEEKISDEQKNVLKKCAEKAGIKKDEDLLDFIMKSGAKNPDAITPEEFQKLLKGLMDKIANSTTSTHNNR